MRTNAGIGNSDDLLIQQYMSGDNNALGTLYNRYYSKVYQKCLSFSKNPDDAFDSTQDILMKAFSKISTFKGNSSFSTWLYAITKNYCISLSSKARSFAFENISAEQNIKDDSPDKEEFELRAEFENKELRLQEVLSTVPDIDKELLDLKYMYNYSVKDLQDKYNLSASAIKMRLMRARHKVELCFSNTII
jgi:RNA polymerase sigma-70 factor (ECF subfamily)